MKAIIPAAGRGTRFLPASKAVPKEMLPVLDKPAIQYVVEEALAAEATEVIIICNEDKPEIPRHFSPDSELVRSLEDKGKMRLAHGVEHAGSLPVSFAQQPEPLGLGHAVHCAAELVADDPEGFFVLLGDVLVPDNRLLNRMREVSQEHGNASVIAVMEVSDEEVSRFGIIEGEPLARCTESTDEAERHRNDGQLHQTLVGRGTVDEGHDAGYSGESRDEERAFAGHADEDTASSKVSRPEEADVWRVRALVEKPSLEDAPSNLAVFGRYLLTPTVMSLLARTQPGAGGEIQLTDALSELLKHEEMFALVIKQDEGFDCGTVEDWLSTNMILASRDAELLKVIKEAYVKIYEQAKD